MVAAALEIPRATPTAAKRQLLRTVLYQGTTLEVAEEPLLATDSYQGTASQVAAKVVFATGLYEDMTLVMTQSVANR